MPFDSNASATVTRQVAVTGQTVLADQVNVPFADIQSMLGQTFLRNGLAPATGPFNMNGFKIANLGDASNDGDAVSLAKVMSLLANVRTVPVGAVEGIRSKTAPAGWIVEDGKTIGSASSGATNRANDDTQDLFVHLWMQFTNAELPIQDSAGAASTRGASAVADFAANKRMPLFDSRSRFLRGADSGLNYDAGLTVGSVQADALKSHAHTGTTNSDGTHRHELQMARARDNDPIGGSYNRAGYSTPGSGSGEDIDPVSTVGSEHSHDFTTNATGNSLETRPRASVVLYCIKL